MTPPGFPEIVRRVLDAYRREFCPKDWNLLPFDMERRGADIFLTVKDETFAPRQVQGRLSGFMLLCGRYFGATLDDAAHAREPVYLRRIGSSSSVEEKAREALTRAANLMFEAGETEEAMFVMRRAVLGSSFESFSGRRAGHPIPKDAPTGLREASLRVPANVPSLDAVFTYQRTTAMSVVVEGFSDPRPLERAVAVCAAEDIIRNAEHRTCPALAETALAGLIGLTRDSNAFVQERALAAIEALAKHLYLIHDGGNLAAAVEPLLAFGVYPAWQLERRMACRYWGGDEAGAREDLQARLALEPGGPRNWVESFEPGLRRAVQAWLSGAAGKAEKAVGGMPAASKELAKPRTPRLKTAPIRPEEFLDVILETLREGVAGPASAGPRSSEECRELVIFLGENPGDGFQGPKYTLKRTGDAIRAVGLYERLRKEYVPKGQPKGLKSIVEEIARAQGLERDMRFAWFLVRDIFKDDDEGKAERAPFESAIARLGAGEPLDDVNLQFGAQCYSPGETLSKRAAELYTRAFRSGQGPALAEAVFGVLPERISAARILHPLFRRKDFKVTLLFGPLNQLRTESFPYGTSFYDPARGSAGVEGAMSGVSPLF